MKKFKNFVVGIFAVLAILAIPMVADAHGHTGFRVRAVNFNRNFVGNVGYGYHGGYNHNVVNFVGTNSYYNTNFVGISYIPATQTVVEEVQTQQVQTVVETPVTTVIRKVIVQDPVVGTRSYFQTVGVCH